MKDIIKHLTVRRLEMQHRMEGKYQLGLIEPGMWKACQAESEASALETQGE